MENEPQVEPNAVQLGIRIAELEEQLAQIPDHPENADIRGSIANEKSELERKRDRIVQDALFKYGQ